MRLNDLIIANRKGYPIRISDIGWAEDSIEEPRGLTRLDGANTVSLFIQKQSGTNIIQISDAMQARLAQLQKGCNAHIATYHVRDSRQFTARWRLQWRMSVGTVRHSTVGRKHVQGRC
jgi:HAE1 family hydrophobic/amphiphilic exporter-1